ncbi:MAG: sigma-E processing peptidase SpoIIGA [Clostridia bacterium]|nr:sigma-E processing peptidase SpoIIGA [Clostridia bacterium]
MKEILYLDVFFTVNFLMDLVSLSVGAFVCSEKIRLFKLLLAAFFGALFSVTELLVSPGPFVTLFFGIFSFPLMAFFALGKRRLERFFKFCIFSFVTSLFLGGVVEMISYYTFSSSEHLTPGIFLAVCFFAFGVFSLWGKSMNRKLETAVVSLSICFSGRCEYFFGLVDSGLLLKEPKSARPVLLLKAAYATPLLSEDFLEKMKTGAVCEKEKLYSIPMRTASGTGQLLAFLPERVCVFKSGKKKNKEFKDVLVALDFSEGGFGGCPCLVPLSVL